MLWQLLQKPIYLLPRDGPLPSVSFLKQFHLRHLIDPLPFVSCPPENGPNQCRIPVYRCLARLLALGGLDRVDHVKIHLIERQTA